MGGGRPGLQLVLPRLQHPERLHSLGIGFDTSSPARYSTLKAETSASTHTGECGGGVGSAG
jgi:hypothetical protein